MVGGTTGAAAAGPAVGGGLGLVFAAVVPEQGGKELGAVRAEASLGKDEKAQVVAVPARGTER